MRRDSAIRVIGVLWRGTLVNHRLGVTGRFLMGKLLIRNVFETKYIPLVFPYPSWCRAM